jgi:MSHA biogenesis protein MshG
MFKSFRIELPLQTRLLIGLSHILSRYGWLIVLALAGLVFVWWLYLRTDGGRLFWHTRKLRLPIVGTIILQLAMARLARITAALHHSGLPILETLALVGDSMSNRVFQVMLRRVRERVKDGVSLTQAMSQEPLVPPVVIQMVATGEETGRLSDLLRSIAEYYEQQAGYVLRRLMVSLEPILLLVVGLGVLLLATAVFVPMWEMVKLFKQGGG